MGQSEPRNLFELESLEPRILLSSDPLVGAVHISATDEVDHPFDPQLQDAPLEALMMSEADIPSEDPAYVPSGYDPFQELDDIFGGLREAEAPAAGGDSESPDPQNPVFQAVIEDDASALEGVSTRATIGGHLEESAKMDSALPLVENSDLGSISGLNEVLDTRLFTPVYEHFNDAVDPPYLDGSQPNSVELSRSEDNSAISVDQVTNGYDDETDEYSTSLDFNTTRTGELLSDSVEEALPILSLSDTSSEETLPTQTDSASHFSNPETVAPIANETSVGIAGEDDIQLANDEPLIIDDVLILDAFDMISGNGEIIGDVINNGTLSPGNSPGYIKFDGDYSQTGTLEIEIGGTTRATQPEGSNSDDSYDYVEVTGQITLGGTLDLSIINSFTPSLSQIYEFLTFGSVSGDFSDFANLWIGEGLYFKPVLGANGYTLEVTQLSFDLELINFDTTAMRDEFLTLLADKASGPISVSGSLEFSDFVAISGTLGFERDGTQIKVSASGVSAKLSTGAFEVGVSNGSLAMLLNDNDTKAIDASGALILSGAGFGSATATEVKVQFNNTGATVNETITINSVSASIDNVADGAGSISVTGVNLTVTDFVSLSGSIGFKKSGADIIAVGTSVTAELSAGDAVNVKLSGADLRELAGLVLS